MTGKVKTGEVVPRRSDAEWADVIRADLAASVQGIIDAGRHLVQAKQQIAHGGWEQWLAAELGMTPRTAQRLTAIARHPVLSNTTHGSLLPASWRTLYELSRLPDAKLTAAIEAGDVSPDMERKDVAALARPEPAQRDPRADKPEQTAGKPGKPPVSADHTPNGSKTAEDSEPGPVQEPAGQVPQTVTETTTETAKTATERKPHVCRVFACPECGRTDTAFSEQAGKLMDELEEARKAACGHGAAWHEQAEWLLKQMAAKGWAWDGRQFGKPGPAGQAAVAGKHAGHRVTANQKNTRARCETCREWFDTAAAS